MFFKALRIPKKGTVSPGDSVQHWLQNLADVIEGKYLEMPCSFERLILVVVMMMAAMETREVN